MARTRYLHYSRLHPASVPSAKLKTCLVLAGIAVGVLIIGNALLQGGVFTSYGEGTAKGSTAGQGGGANNAEPSRPTPPQNRSYENALQKKAVEELHAYGAWLKRYNAKGFVGEIGWPAGADAAQWNAIAERWYVDAEYYDLWVTAWAAGSWWGDYPLTIYGKGSGPGLGQNNPQATVLDRHLTSPFGDPRGVNLAGMEFGEVTAEKPGVAGQDYFYEPESSLQYLADQGVRTIRLPFRWERIQPTLNGELASSEVAEIRKLLDAADKQGIKVILDLHNYGAYKTAGRELLLGDGKLTHDHLTDVWLKLSKEFKSHKAVLAYGLMNEPHDLPAGSYGSSAKNWEAASQTVVTALRKAGDKKTITVAGYDWSSLGRWEANHPRGWIKDPANNFRYEAHHYWDSDASGFYQRSFSAELKALR